MNKLSVALLFAALSVANAAIAAPGDKLCVTEAALREGAAVRATPNNDAPIVMIIGAGRMVVEFERKDGWMFVGIDRAGGRDGYIRENFLAPTDLDGLPCGAGR